MPTELEEVIPPPKELKYLWDWVCDHTYPLSFMELEAWSRLTGKKLQRWQIQVMVELDKVRSYG